MPTSFQKTNSKNTGSFTDTFFALNCFFGAWLAGFFLVYRGFVFLTTLDISVWLISVLAVVPAVIIVFMGQTARRFIRLQKSYWTLAILVLLGILAVWGGSRIPKLTEINFVLPKDSFHSEQEKQRTSTEPPMIISEWQIMTIPKRFQRWTVLVKLDSLEDLRFPVTVSFEHPAMPASTDSAQTIYHIEVSRTAPSFEIDSITPFENVRTVCQSGVPVQLDCYPRFLIDGVLALLLNCGFILLPLIPFGFVLIFVVGLVQGLLRIKNHVKWFRQKVQKPIRVERTVFELEYEPSSEPTYGGFLHLRKSELIAFCIAMFVMMMLRLPLYSPIKTNIEEFYNPMFHAQSGQGIAFASCETGRFTYYFMHWCLDLIGITPWGGIFVNIPLATACFLITGLILARLWRISSSLLATTILLLCIALHPFIQEIFHYRIALLHWVVFPLAVLPYLIVRKNSLSILLCSFFLAIAIGSYHSFINVSGTAFLIYLVIEGINELRRRAIPSYSRLWERCRVSECLSITFYGCLLNLIIEKLFTYFIPSGNELRYADPLLLQFLPERIDFLIRYVYVNLYSIMPPNSAKNLSFSVPLNFLQIIVAILIVLGLLRLGLSRYFGRILLKRFYFVSFLIGILLLTSYVAPLGVVTIVEWKAFPPRILMFISFFWGGVFAVAWLLVRHQTYLKRSLITVFTILIISYAYFLSQFLVEVFQITQREYALAVRIVADLERQPEFADIKKICVVPMFAELCYVRSNRIAESAFTRTAFNGGYQGKVDILNEVSGYNFITVHCPCPENMPVWPAPGSIVIVDGDTAVIRIQ